MQYFLGFILLISASGILAAKKPVYAALSFLATLILLAAHYLMLSAEFIAVMQILVYAGAILVLFIFVMMLFQDAYAQLRQFLPQSSKLLIALATALFLVGISFVTTKISGISSSSKESLPHGFGQAALLGKTLYLDFFFPFEAVLLLFLVGIVGAVFIGKKDVTK